MVHKEQRWIIYQTQKESTVLFTGQWLYKRDAIKYHEQCFGKSWAELHKKGHRCIKANIQFDITPKKVNQ